MTLSRKKISGHHWKALTQSKLELRFFSTRVRIKKSGFLTQFCLLNHKTILPLCSAASRKISHQSNVGSDNPRKLSPVSLCSFIFKAALLAARPWGLACCCSCYVTGKNSPDKNLFSCATCSSVKKSINFFPSFVSRLLVSPVCF